jgi:hypothetical protein
VGNDAEAVALELHGDRDHEVRHQHRHLKRDDLAHTHREDRAIRTDSNGLSESQTYTYEPNPNGERHWFRRRKNGTWEEVKLNHKTDRYRKTGGLGLRIGEREEYRDPSF